MSALDLLADASSVASVVCRAIDKALGDGWRLWEPQTLWTELHIQGCDVPVLNRQKVMAGRSILTTGRLYFDAMVFDRTAAAFGNELLDIDGFDDASAGLCAWAADEARRICEQEGESPHEYDREVVELVAQRLHREGFLVAPQELHFAQKALDRRWGEHTSDLKREVAELWAEVQEHPLPEVRFPETPKGVQLARLASVKVFLEERRAVRSKQAARL